MGASGLTAVVVLLLASALLRVPASAGRSLLEGENPNSGGEDAPAPTVSGKSSAAGQQQAESKRQQNSLAPLPSASSPPPPPPTQETNSHKAASPPPGGGAGPNGGTDPEDTGSQGRRMGTDKLKEAMEKCDASHKCSSGKEFSACLQVSEDASVGSYIIVKNEGQHDIDINVKEPSSNTDNDKKSLHLIKGAFGQMNITYTTSDAGNITLSDGKVDCIIHVGQPVERKSVYDLQQQFQQLTAYAMRLNPAYGASFFVFTVVLVAVGCACCKFAKRKGNDGVPYQQLEMGGQAPNSSGVDNTASTTDGWEDGWDDDWDDEEAPAGPVDKKPTGSVSANGLSLRSQTNSKDGWDVDWDD
ncbi:uncharacterized protein LOC100275141 precursor [Zea mays]|uniref:DUF7356 domain-containing protein n=1 Tax=Zea mays TaxID=4577 RepID=B4FVP1_MAIZE|nr:uncharacterized protein LOC100275141 precursor [Zea mays]ACF86184.1 unknown [Zea mays]ACG26579.1 hypothetical protein [Zea mays]AQK94472.1 hypothetical protein ZEAMMB73_Zm00001d010615 [Zea mays]|eukprot:NP_001142780.1 uncharacterized protein LOC100275141 precursor [Zea mays]